jgi:hypothetical protein
LADLRPERLPRCPSGLERNGPASPPKVLQLKINHSTGRDADQLTLLVMRLLEACPAILTSSAGTESRWFFMKLTVER